MTIKVPVAGGGPSAQSSRHQRNLSSEPLEYLSRASSSDDSASRGLDVGTRLGSPRHSPSSGLAGYVGTTMADQTCVNDGGPPTPLLARSKVVLDVGGTLFSTFLSTLVSEPDSLFAAMFSGRHASVAPDPYDHSYFLDRDPLHFRHILNHLRGVNSIQYINSLDALQELYGEASYYRLQRLMDTIRVHPLWPPVSQEELESLYPHIRHKWTIVDLSYRNLTGVEFMGWKIAGGSDFSGSVLRDASFQGAMFGGDVSGHASYWTAGGRRTSLVSETLPVTEDVSRMLLRAANTARQVYESEDSDDDETRPLRLSPTLFPAGLPMRPLVSPIRHYPPSPSSRSSLSPEARDDTCLSSSLGARSGSPGADSPCGPVSINFTGADLTNVKFPLYFNPHVRFLLSEAKTQGAINLKHFAKK
jgi:hypothetical protein